MRGQRLDEPDARGGASLTQTYSPRMWAQPEWLEEAHAWIHAQLDGLSIALARAITQLHVRPWSTVLRVPTGEGDVYFKASVPALAHEPVLTQALFRWRPDCFPTVLAIDAARGWLLMRDSGATLRSMIHGIGDLHHWREVLPLYARLQIEMAPRAEELLALGVPDRRLSRLPDRFGRLLDDTAFLRIDEPGGLTSDEHQRLRAFTPNFWALCEEIATGGIPPTLHHDDLHDGNVFVQEGRYIFTDWGEAFVAHPFFTLVVTLRSIAHTLDLDAGDPVLTGLCELYLGPWKQFAPPDRLQKIFPLAQHAGTVCRALTWYGVVSALPEPERTVNLDAVTGWLREALALVKIKGQRVQRA